MHEKRAGGREARINLSNEFWRSLFILMHSALTTTVSVFSRFLLGDVWVNVERKLEG